jgi:hypothetical protein
MGKDPAHSPGKDLWKQRFSSFPESAGEGGPSKILPGDRDKLAFCGAFSLKGDLVMGGDHKPGFVGERVVVRGSGAL